MVFYIETLQAKWKIIFMHWLQGYKSSMMFESIVEMFWFILFLFILQQAVSSVVGNVTFDLKKKYPYNDTTEMKVGSRVRFQLTITFPIEDTDMLVELFTPDNDTTVMILCDVNVTKVGNSLGFNGSKVPVMDSREPNSVMVRCLLVELTKVYQHQ